MRSDFCSFLLTTCICKSLSALLLACFEISCRRFVNMSARKVPGERKTANEQLPLLAQTP